MVTLFIAKDHVAGQSMGLITRWASGGFEYAGDGTRPSGRRAAAQSHHAERKEDKWPSFHSSFPQHDHNDAHQPHLVRSVARKARYGSTASPPHSAGSRSASVSVNVH